MVFLTIVRFGKLSFRNCLLGCAPNAPVCHLYSMSEPLTSGSGGKPLGGIEVTLSRLHRIARGSCSVSSRHTRKSERLTSVTLLQLKQLRLTISDFTCTGGSLWARV